MRSPTLPAPPPPFPAPNDFELFELIDDVKLFRTNESTNAGRFRSFRELLRLTLGGAGSIGKGESRWLAEDVVWEDVAGFNDASADEMEQTSTDDCFVGRWAADEKRPFSEEEPALAESRLAVDDSRFGMGGGVRFLHAETPSVHAETPSLGDTNTSFSNEPENTY